MHGRGVMHIASGVYKGMFVEGQIHGRGAFTYHADGRKCAGFHVCGVLVGYGSATLCSSLGNEIQTGRFVGCVLQGVGTRRFANGCVHQVTFENGVYQMNLDMLLVSC